MELIDVIRQAQGGNAISNMARTFNLTDDQAEAAIQAVIPELTRGIERNTLSRGGIADLIAAMGNGTALRNLQSPAMFGDPNVQADGNAMLGHILGTKDASRGAAQRAALSSGIGEGLIKMLLPYIAQMLIGALTSKTQGGLGDILSKIPGMPGNQPPTGNGGATPNSGGLSFPRRPAPAPSAPGNAPFGTNAGSGGFEGQAPLPLPTNLPPDSNSGASNPYGDLSDIIRGGRSAGGAAASGGTLWSVIRNMLSGVLGFSTKGGVLGWIFRAVILRYGWNIVRAILGGLLGRR